MLDSEFDINLYIYYSIHSKINVIFIDIKKHMINKRLYQFYQIIFIVIDVL